MTDSDIRIKLDLDDDGYRVSAQRVMGEVGKLAASLQRLAPAVKGTDAQFRATTHNFRDMVLVAGSLRFALLSLYDVFGRLPMNIMKNAGELERMQQLMKGLSKEATDTGRALEGVRDFNFVVGMAKKAPFEISSLSDSFVKLKVAGIDPTKGSLQTLVDSVAKFGGSSDVLKRASVAISQMAGKGVVSMEELRQQLGEAIPNAMQAMADGLAMSMSSLTKIVSTGTLAAGPAIKAMLRELRSQNTDAAAEMMDTWVGMNAQLKTEWMLTSKAIADSGFGGAMKSAVGGLIDMLRDPAFINWSTGFGQSLGNAVTAIQSLTKFLVENAEIIKYGILAWAAYKVQTGIIAGTLRSLGERYQDVSKKAKSFSDGMRSYSSQEVARIQDAATRRTQDLQAAKAASAEKIEAIRRENGTLMQLQRQRVEEHGRMTKQLAAFDARVAGLKGKFDAGTATKADSRAIGKLTSQAADMDKMRLAASALSNTIGQQEKIMQVNERAVGALTNSMLQSERAMKTANVTMQRNVMVFTAQQMAANAASVAVRGFSIVTGALGGPIGIALTALMYLAYRWNDVENAARAAGEAQERAAAGTTIAGDTKLIEDKLKTAEARLKYLQGDVAATHKSDGFLSSVAGMVGIDTSVQFKKTAEQLRADTALAKGQVAEVEKLRNELSMSKENDLTRAAQQSANYALAMAGKEVNAIKEATRQKKSAIHLAMTQELENFKGTEKEKAAAKQKYTRQNYEAEAKSSEQQADYWDKVRAQLIEKQKTATTAEARSLTIQVESAAKQAEEARRVAESFREVITPEILGKDDKDKGGKRKKTPFADFVERVKADAEQLAAELDNVERTGEKGFAVAGLISRLESDFKAGKFAKEGVTKSRLDALIASISANGQAKRKLKEAEDAAKAVEHVNAYLDRLAPEYQEALGILVDPLGASDSGEKLKSVQRELSVHVEKYEVAAKRMGMTFDELASKVRAQAASVDTSGQVRTLAEDTQQLQSQLTNVSREETAKRLRLEADASNRRMQNLYDEVKAAGAAEWELQTLRSEMAANTHARSLLLQQQTAHPLEQLASDWGNLKDNLTNSTVNWANQVSDAFVTMATTGKLTFKDMAKSILADLARLAANKAFSQLLSMGLNALGMAGMASAGTGLTASAGAAGSYSPGSFDYSVGSGGGGLGLTRTNFANGGIMTEFGSVPLKKYAKGGVAKSPQLALYGEGSMNEAYVPLPDGRSIPVTMEGGAGSQVGQVNNVSISIVVNKDGSDRKQSSGGNSDVFAQMAERIKGVVREELVTQQRQGGLLTK